MSKKGVFLVKNEGLKMIKIGKKWRFLAKK